MFEVHDQRSIFFVSSHYLRMSTLPNIKTSVFPEVNRISWTNL